MILLRRRRPPPALPGDVALIVKLKSIAVVATRRDAGTTHDRRPCNICPLNLALGIGHQATSFHRLPCAILLMVVCETPNSAANARRVVVGSFRLISAT